jgi:hypothetical protein
MSEPSFGTDLLADAEGFAANTIDFDSSTTSPSSSEVMASSVTGSRQVIRHESDFDLLLTLTSSHTPNWQRTDEHLVKLKTPSTLGYDADSAPNTYQRLDAAHEPQPTVRSCFFFFLARAIYLSRGDTGAS